MKKMQPIYTGLIAAVLLASVSTSASAIPIYDDAVHWAPYVNAFDYFFGCTIMQKCEGSKWR
ncbi:MAG: hypothetical protein ACNYPI_02480 [Arenicellales bacterium WSBS_2016_MAG_OTU3]